MKGNVAGDGTALATRAGEAREVLGVRGIQNVVRHLRKTALEATIAETLNEIDTHLDLRLETWLLGETSVAAGKAGVRVDETEIATEMVVVVMGENETLLVSNLMKLGGLASAAPNEALIEVRSEEVVAAGRREEICVAKSDGIAVVRERMGEERDTVRKAEVMLGGEKRDRDDR